MGYETKMYVVRPYSFEWDEPLVGGELLAMVELCKCGYDGAVAKLISKSIAKAKESKKSFYLWANNPDRQQEAVDLLVEIADDPDWLANRPLPKDEKEKIEELAGAIEDGRITTDKYGDPLPIIEVDEMIAAFEEDNKQEPYRRFDWALAILKAIKQSEVSGVRVVTYGH